MKKMNFTTLILFTYDLIIAVLSSIFILFIYGFNGNNFLLINESLYHALLFLIVLLVFRFFGRIYKQIWRYGGVECYIRLIVCDGLSFVVFYILERIIRYSSILTLGNSISLFSIELILSLSIRIAYRYCYKHSGKNTKKEILLNKLLKVFSFNNVNNNSFSSSKTAVAILGAGRTGVSLAEELLGNNNSEYIPTIFLENNREKIGRDILGLKVYGESCDQIVFDNYEIKEVIFTVPDMDIEKRQELYKRYKSYGLKVKVYDYPIIETANAKKTLREFDIEDLLFRKTVSVVDDETKKYYKNKVVLITGGGGSIGSEMARQIAKMEPKQLILVDIYENGVYDVQTELKIIYKDKISINVEICSIVNRNSLYNILKEYKPDVVIMAAAHKHVPLMEKNCIEAIENNVFGTLNTVELSIKNSVRRVIMVSTDKAVNPTNVMGATKRMCEMIVKAHAENKKSKTTFSMTRFGNVLGSAGSVIPLFKKQIEFGGPITITDKRIIRYFMTIPEASQLVLKSGAMAKNGELFVLDMGKPVKILDLAESMIKLSGLTPYKDIDIVEIGLRPGEKLYEELLINTDNLTKTKDKLIFIDHDEPLSIKELNKKLDILKKACASKDNLKAKKVLKQVVPTFKDPEEVNK